SRGSNIRYFRVISNSIERVRVAPSSSHDKEQSSSIATKFYTPSIRLKI
ncbi:unnamed protein product, partial [Adineta steineri]